VRGYGTLAAGHLAAAWEVRMGMADCCIATRAAARVFGLSFIPLISARYDLVLRKKHLDLPAMQNLMDTLSRSKFRRELEGLGGYDARTAGELKK
jgi:putative molybdopterin biosynthesis protein